MVFKVCVCIGYYFSEFFVEVDIGNFIISCIFWFCGFEFGVNCGGDVDFYVCYIYIYGINCEVFFG